MEVSFEGLGVQHEDGGVEQLEPLFIYEEGDEIKSGADRRDSGSRLSALRENSGEASEVGKDVEEKVGEGEAGHTEAEDFRDETQRENENQKATNRKETELSEEWNLEGGRNDQVSDERVTDMLEGQSSTDVVTEAEHGAEKQSGACSEKEGAAKNVEKGEDELKTGPGVQLPVKPSSELRPRDRLNPQDAQKQVRRLTPDFPDSLYELLCSLQEGRRLNDQRCSFGLDRRCHSEPSTPVLRHKVVFSSMTSLQKEEFFELLATSQGRRLDDQRAELHDIPPAPALTRNKFSQRKFSLKNPALKEVPAKPTPKEDLYNMILTSQAQGRLEDQRSAAPGPMDDEDFFSLLLKVQGGRMDEQRTELPVTLKD